MVVMTPKCLLLRIQILSARLKFIIIPIIHHNVRLPKSHQVLVKMNDMPLVHYDWFFLIAPLTLLVKARFFPPTIVTTSKSVAPYTMMNTTVTVLPSLQPSTGEGVTSLQEPREIQSHFSAMIRFVGSVLLPLAFYFCCKELQLHGILLHALLIATVVTACLQ